MLLHRQKPNQLCYILRYFMYKLYICCCCCGTAQIAESREPPEFNRSWPPTLYYSAKHNLFCINKYTHTRIKSTVLAHDIAWAQSKVAVGTYYCIISQLTRTKGELHHKTAFNGILSLLLERAQLESV